MHVLTDLREHDRHARILTDRHIILACKVAVGDHFTEDGLAERRLLRVLTIHERLPQICGQIVVGINAQLTHQLGYFRNLNRPHFVLLYSGAPFTKTACT